MKPLVVVVLGMASVATAFLPSPGPGNIKFRSTTHQPFAATTDGNSKRNIKPLSWQESLELLISPLTPLPQRQVLFQDIVSRAPEIRKDVEVAIKEGNVDGLLTEGVKAVRRQLAEDIIPQLAAEPEQAAKLLLEEIPKLAQQSIDNLPKNPKDLADAVRDISTTLPSEARNVFLRTPEGLETPAFEVLKETDEYQIRKYDSYTIATTRIPAASASSPVMGSPTSTGTAFNTLASYLFGSNSRRESMAMTTPVEIRKGGADSYTMSFFMPSKFSTSNAPPPSDDRVTLTDLPTEILAAKDFPGFATDGEVKRQVMSLLRALDRDGIEVPDPSSYRVFQYNPPYTLPWLRRNEVLLLVNYNQVVESLRESIPSMGRPDSSTESEESEDMDSGDDSSPSDY